MKSLLLPFLAISFAAHGSEEMFSVRTVTPRPAVETARYEIPGRTEPIEQATIFTRATGIVKERAFEIGDSVKAGEIMASIDAPEIDREVEAAQANVEQSLARATNDRKISARSSQLRSSDVVSEQESEQSQLTAAESAAGVRVARAALSRLEEQQRFSQVRAPFDGIVAARNFDRGDHVRGDSASADQWLYRLIRIDRLRFVISAPPDLALRLAKEDGAILRFREFPGREFPATVAHSSRVFDPDSGTMRVELQIANEDLTLPAGLTGTAQFRLPPVAGTYLVPANALVLREGRTLIAIADNGRARFVEASPGRNFGAEVEVLSSQLSESSAVILNPNAMIREGDAIAAAPLAAK